MYYSNTKKERNKKTALHECRVWTGIKFIKEIVK